MSDFNWFTAAVYFLIISAIYRSFLLEGRSQMGTHDLHTPYGHCPGASDTRGRPYEVADIAGHV